MAAVDLHPPKVSAAANPPVSASRPQSQSGYRFGQLSRSSFFARHNPHPHRCIHIKGLLGLPIPVVVDDCDHSSYETHLCFPPNGHNDQRLHSQRLLLPVNAIHLNSHNHPLDTVNGLQYFTNLRNYSFKEKAVPRLGLVPVTESWREQLRSLTEQTFHPPVAPPRQQQDMGLRREATFPDWRTAGAAPHAPAVAAAAEAPAGKPATASRPMYSQQTGRLIPPPSRAMSRRPLRSSHRATPANVLAHYEHISASPDLESAVFSMLCQILQTEDFNAVQAWLVSASDRERALVMDVIRSAVANRAAYYEADSTGEAFEPVDIRSDLHLPPILEASSEPPRFDRLVIEDVEPAVAAEPPLTQSEPPQPEKQRLPDDAKPAAGTKTARQLEQPPAAEQQQQQKQQHQVKQEQKPGGGKKVAAAAAAGAKVNNGKAKQGTKVAKLKYSKTEPPLRKAGKSKDVWRPQDSYAA